MNKNTKKFVVTLLSVLMVLSFMPTMAFAAVPSGSHGYKADDGEHAWTYTAESRVPANTEGLEVLIEPTCTTDGVGLLSCTREMNGEVCGFKRTVRIAALGHKRGSKIRVTSKELLDLFEWSTDYRNWFYSRWNTNTYCQAYVYDCDRCGVYLQENGEDELTSPLQAFDRITEHTPATDTKECAASFTCSVCERAGLTNADYNQTNADTHHANASADVTVTTKNVHQINNNSYVTVTRKVCNICGEEWLTQTLHGYNNNWNNVSHGPTTRVVTGEASCTERGTYEDVCNDCGRVVSRGQTEVLPHQYQRVPLPDPIDHVYYSAEICSVCGYEKPNSREPIGLQPLDPDAVITYSVVAEATCEQGAWILATETIGEKVVNTTLLDDEYIETLINAGTIIKIGEKYYYKASQKEIPYTAALGHEFGEITTVAEATCEDRALEGKVCSKCGKPDHATLKRVGKALGHDKQTVTVAPTCGKPGYSYDTCARCKKIFDPYPAPGEWVELEEGTTDDEIAYYYGYNRVDPIVSAGAECDFQWTVTKAPTATENGEEALVCTKCGAVKAGSQTVIPKDSDKAKEIAISLALPIIGQAADIMNDTANYKASSIAAIKEAKEILNAAIGAGTAADVNNAAAALEALVQTAEKKDANPMVAKGKTVKAKSKKNTTFSKAKAFKISGAKGTVTFKKKSGNKKVTVSKAGKVTVKKGLKKGKTYKIKVTVKAAGNGDYKAKSQVVTLKVKVTK